MYAENQGYTKGRGRKKGREAREGEGALGDGADAAAR